MSRVKVFMDQNQATWSKLETVLNTFGQRPTQKQLEEVSLLYRQVSAHLAYAQTHFPQHEIHYYLETLVIRSHNIIYGAKKKNHWKTILHFFTQEFPYLFYERARFFLIALSLLLIGYIFAYLLTWINQDYAKIILGNLTPLHPDELQEQQWNHAIISSTIMVNNIYVAFFCFAWGALFGIGTVWALILNGATIGSLASLYDQMDSSYIFWAYIWPHGIIELTAIFIAGAAGLSLAYRFFVPGDLTRYQSFKNEGKVTIKLVLGVIPMFVIAAIIEGYITPAPWPYWTKYLFSAVTLFLLMFYLGRPFLREGMIRNQQITKSTSPHHEKRILI